jgi:hypothetical protein
LNGRKARGRHFNSRRKFLIDGGFVTERDGKIEPVEAAFERLSIPRKKKPRTRDVDCHPTLAGERYLARGRRPARRVPIEDFAGRLGLAPRGGHRNTGVNMLRVNDLIRASPAGFELGHALT